MEEERIQNEENQEHSTEPKADEISDQENLVAVEPETSQNEQEQRTSPISISNKESEDDEVFSIKEFPDESDIENNNYPDDKATTQDTHETEFLQNLCHVGVASAHHDGFIRFWDFEVHVPFIFRSFATAHQALRMG